jgi:hypothetical protein
MSLADRLGWAALIVALLGIATIYIWPTQKWIGYLSFAAAVILGCVWGVLEIKERRGSATAIPASKPIEKPASRPPDTDSGKPPSPPKIEHKHPSFSSTPSQNQAKIRVDDLTAVWAPSVQPNPPPWSAFNVNYSNFGELPADEIANMVSWFFQIGELSPETVISEQDKLLNSTAWEKLMLTKKGIELYKEDKGQFFSIPYTRTDAGFSKIQEYFASTDVNKKFYVLVVFKYRDRSMAPNVRGVTEHCGFIVGNAGAQHICGRNRIFLEQSTPSVVQPKQP